MPISARHGRACKYLRRNGLNAHDHARRAAAA
jgi:hypothetical protein